MADYSADTESHARSSETAAKLGMRAARSDVLSEVLTLIRLRGELVYTAHLGAPWGIRFPAGPAHFHYVERGEAWITPAGAAPHRIGEGDLALLPLGRGHVLADAEGTAIEDIETIAAGHFDRNGLVLRHGKGDANCVIFSGYFNFDSPLPTIMSALAPLIHIPRAESGAPPWLRAISGFLAGEAQTPSPGSLLMISRLIELLVIRTLRSWTQNEANRIGWLGGLGDERIGRALSAIHADPFKRWTVQSLAAVAAMSRSTFAERFAAIIGEPPLHYLTRWRLTIAADLLRGGGLKVTEAAQRIGYSSDAAFSRAFKAHFGYAPSEARDRRP